MYDYAFQLPRILGPGRDPENITKKIERWLLISVMRQINVLSLSLHLQREEDFSGSVKTVDRQMKKKEVEEEEEEEEEKSWLTGRLNSNSDWLSIKTFWIIIDRCGIDYQQSQIFLQHFPPDLYLIESHDRKESFLLDYWVCRSAIKVTHWTSIMGWSDMNERVVNSLGGRGEGDGQQRALKMLKDAFVCDIW